MKTKLCILLCIVFVSGLVVWSCSGEERFTYYLENASRYTIDSGRLDEHHFELEPNEVAGPFELVTVNGPASFFSEPMLLLEVVVYSDADSTYKRRDGVTHGRETMRENATYLIRIVERRDSVHMYFGLEIEEKNLRKEYSHARK